MSISFNDPIFWFFVLTMCSIALLTEVTRLVHGIFITRQRLWWYLLAMMAVALNIWSFTVALDISNKFDYLSLVTHIHINQAWWLAMISPLIHVCQLQIAVTILVFAILLFVEKEVFPRSVQPPVWTLTKDHPLSANR